MAPGKENLCEVSSEQVLCFFFSFSFLFYLDIYLLIRLLICVKTRTVDIWQIYYLSPTRSTLRGIMIVNDLTLSENEHHNHHPTTAKTSDNKGIIKMVMMLLVTSMVMIISCFYCCYSIC